MSALLQCSLKVSMYDVRRWANSPRNISAAAKERTGGQRE
jgi:hypothetical protein